MVVAPPVHVHVLVVQIAFLLFAVVARVVPPVVWVGARVAPLHEHELPVVQELPPDFRRSRQNGWLGTRVRESQMTCVRVRVTTSSEVVHRRHRDEKEHKGATKRN